MPYTTHVESGKGNSLIFVGGDCEPLVVTLLDSAIINVGSLLSEHSGSRTERRCAWPVGNGVHPGGWNTRKFRWLLGERVLRGRDPQGDTRASRSQRALFLQQPTSEWIHRD